jgi:hypothetical protein
MMREIQTLEYQVKQVRLIIKHRSSIISQWCSLLTNRLASSSSIGTYVTNRLIIFIYINHHIKAHCMIIIIIYVLLIAYFAYLNYIMIK